MNRPPIPCLFFDTFQHAPLYSVMVFLLFQEILMPFSVAFFLWNQRESKLNLTKNTLYLEVLYGCRS